ncbi:hypothetical protein IE81DRAFT_238317 [Ceraceosorus guamensis]|uniref:Uncharacterized protein n=1 Tax=Ceraceosorus guamensis TaxID=1522189 RepID=A0A316VR95_9BASI|nr:hypothetical protein IE81DRAFT_238317 [Ceraceosorus guamensis]PWN40116.1 hypothetical protein IE81DRAFT_238317 [Ceraceosorus guamensis]
MRVVWCITIGTSSAKRSFRVSQEALRAAKYRLLRVEARRMTSPLHPFSRVLADEIARCQGRRRLAAGCSAIGTQTSSMAGALLRAWQEAKGVESA